MTEMTRSAVLCCDLGGSSLRLGLVNGDGKTGAATSVPLAIAADAEGISEMDPSRWWEAFLATARTLVQADPSGFANIAAVAICGMTRTQVLVDETGTPVRPALTFLDTRARAIALQVASETALDHIDAWHPLARLAWVARSEPELFARAAFVLEPKDYLALRLCGTAASDTISQARLAELDSASAPIVATCQKLLPPLLRPGTKLGSLQAGLPVPFDKLAGRPVIMASNDTWTAVAGLGAMRPRCGYNISGTSEVLGMIGTAAASAEGLVTVDWDNGLFQLGGPSQTGADVLGWLETMLGDGTKELIAGADRAPLHPRPLLFLPFLQGERVPFWNPDLRAAFVGLDRAHGPRDIVRAVLEGVAFANREVLARAERAFGETATEIRFGGGGARNRSWCQVKADVCQRAIVTTECDEPGLLGCAAVAFAGLGCFPSLAEAQANLVRTSERFLPRNENRSRYDALFAVYRQAVSTDIQLSTALAAVPRPG